MHLKTPLSRIGLLCSQVLLLALILESFFQVDENHMVVVFLSLLFSLA